MIRDLHGHIYFDAGVVEKASCALAIPDVCVPSIADVQRATDD